MSTKNITDIPAGGHSTAAASAGTTSPTVLLRARPPPAAAVVTLQQSNFLQYTSPHETYGRETGPSKVSSRGIVGGSQAAAFVDVYLLSVR